MQARDPLLKKDAVLSDGSPVRMNLVTLSPDAALVWADDVAMIAHHHLRLPLQRRVWVSPTSPHWLRVRTPYAIIEVTDIKSDFVHCRVTPTAALIELDAALDGYVFSAVGTSAQYPRAYWYQMFYGIGQTSRYYMGL